MSSANNPKVSFLTWNIYQGFDVLPLFNAPQDQLPVAVTQLFRQFLATNFPLRAKAIAEAIALKKPNLIGLQEAVRIELFIPTFGTVVYDFIEILLAALAEQGVKYELAILNKNTEAQLPDSNGNTVRFLDRDAILIRKNNKLDVINKQQGNFVARVPTPLIIITQGWSYVDVKLEGKVFRMVNTHLNPNVKVVRDAQAQELINLPANTSLPVIVTGDLNDTPNSDMHQLFMAAGFQDLWNEVGGGPGFTNGQNADLLNPVSLLDRRIDYVLFKNGWVPIDADLVGEAQHDRTPTGLWPSDHAGLSANLRLGN